MSFRGLKVYSCYEHHSSRCKAKQFLVFIYKEGGYIGGFWARTTGKFSSFRGRMDFLLQFLPYQMNRSSLSYRNPQKTAMKILFQSMIRRTQSLAQKPSELQEAEKATCKTLKSGQLRVLHYVDLLNPVGHACLESL